MMNGVIGPGVPVVAALLWVSLEGIVPSLAAELAVSGLLSAIGSSPDDGALVGADGSFVGVEAGDCVGRLVCPLGLGADGLPALFDGGAVVVDPLGGGGKEGPTSL